MLLLVAQRKELPTFRHAVDEPEKVGVSRVLNFVPPAKTGESKELQSA